MIETKRLCIRKFMMDDLFDFHEMISNPEVAGKSGWMQSENIAQTEKILIQLLHDPAMYAIVLKETNKLIGSISIHQVFNRAVMTRELAYALNQDYWGHGYMKEAVWVMIDEAFRRFGTEMLVVRVSENNFSSKKVVAGFCFRQEGTLRKAGRNMVTKEILNIIVYSMTKGEWEEWKH